MIFYKRDRRWVFQKSNSAFGAEQEEDSVWPHSNWVSNLTSLPLASLLLLSDKTMCGQCTFECVDKITVFSYQNEMTKRGWEMFERVGVLAGSLWTKQKYSTVGTFWTAWKQKGRNEKVCWDLFAHIRTLGSLLIPDKWKPSVHILPT